MKALVTGGAGYIGSNLCDELLAQEADVSVIDNLSTGSIRNIEHLLRHPRFRFVNDTILRSEILERLVAECDVVYHLAAAVGVRYIVEDPIGTIATNVAGTENLLRLAHRYWKRVVIASTSEVYGKSNGGALHEDDDRVLGPTTINRWSYSASKAIDEHMAYAYGRTGLPIAIVRYFNSYGPRVNEAGYGSVIANFIRQALKHEPLTVHGDGLQTRCFTYVTDTVRGTLLAGTRPEALGEVFNVGNDREITIRELAQLVIERSGSDSAIVHVPYRDYYGQNYEDTPRRRPDVSKAEQYLGFRAGVALEDGLRRTIDWCRQNYDLAPGGSLCPTPLPRFSLEALRVAR